MKKITDIALILCYVAALIFIPVFSVCMPDAAITRIENRELQQIPKWNGFHLTAFTTACEDYVVDQFPYREQLLALYSQMQVRMGKRMVRNLHIVEDQWLLPRDYDREAKQLETYTNAIISASVEYNHVPFYYLLVPFKTGTLYQLDPRYINNFYAEENHEDLIEALDAIENLKILDAVDYFEQNYSVDDLRDMYYKTDYHWNAIGAQRAALFLQQELYLDGFLDLEEKITEGDLVFAELPGQYIGDLGKQLSYAIHASEQASVFTLADTHDIRYFESVDDTKPVEREHIVGEARNKQTLTYNGVYTENRGCYRVINPHAHTNKRVLVLKDSFQNPTTDFLTTLFAEIIVIDPRYYREPYDFDALMEQMQPDMVLLWYHQSNFSPELVRFLQPSNP